MDLSTLAKYMSTDLENIATRPDSPTGAEPTEPQRSPGFHIMAKPVGPICNLNCRYCFYLEKENLYPAAASWAMPDDVLESYVRQYIEAQDAPTINFAWQGGEPTLLGVDYFRRVVELEKQYANGKQIENAFQTNGILLDDAWAEFLAQNRFLVGLSLDGPAELHDCYRVNKGDQPTFGAVLRGLEYLKKHGVEFNTLTVVHRRNSRHPLEVYRFLKEVGSMFMQFIPLVERVAKAPDPHGLVLIGHLATRRRPRSPNGPWSHCSSANSCARSSTNGCVATWRGISSNSSMSHWKAGWGCRKAYAYFARPAARAWPLSITATYTPAIITYIRRTG